MEINRDMLREKVRDIEEIVEIQFSSDESPRDVLKALDGIVPTARIVGGDVLERLEEVRKKLEHVLVVDGSSLASRSFYIKENPFTFFNMLSKVINELGVSHVVFAFDRGEDTFRKGIYPDYKGNREDNEARQQYVDDIADALDGAGFCVLFAPEGDDAVASAVEEWLNTRTSKVYVLSGDTDLMALVRDRVRVVWYGSSFADRAVYDEKAVEEKVGVPPDDIYDYVALKGEAPDNIPGVKGVGPVGAKKLLQGLEEGQTLVDLLELGVEGRYSKAIEKGRESALISRQLVEMVPYPVELEGTRIDGKNPFGDVVKSLVKVWSE